MPSPRTKPGFLRSVTASLLSPFALAYSWVSGYNATDPRRKIVDRTRLPASSTANQILNGSLPALRNYCRNLERNNPTARAGLEALVALVVGSGISLEPDTGDEATDARIRAVFQQWCDSAGVHGESIWSLQGLGMREMVAAGEGVWRLVDDGNPLPSILPLDAEWIDELTASSNDLTTVAGVIIDRLGREKGLMLRNPEGMGDAEEVLSQSVIHFFERRRPVQHRGEPWFAPLIERLIQEQDLVDADLKAAVNTAGYAVAITSEMSPGTTTDENGEPVTDIPLGSVVSLLPGEDIKLLAHNRPSQAIAPFREMLRGDIAAALRVPSRFLDRDVSRANFSSMRADMLDTERLLGPLREEFGRQTIGAVYERILPRIAAMLAIPIPPARYRLLPDGQPYVDPQKDVAAAKAAMDSGLSTLEAEVAKRGGDYRQLRDQRIREMDDEALANIERIKKVQAACDASGVPGLTWAHIVTVGGAVTAPGAYLAASVQALEATVVAGEEQADQPDDAEREQRSRSRREPEHFTLNAYINPQPVNVSLPAQEHHHHIRNEMAAPILPPAPAPVVQVTVDPTPVTIQPAMVTVRNDVHVPESAPAPAPIVNVAAPSVTVQNDVLVEQRPVLATPQRDGSVLMVPQGE